MKNIIILLNSLLSKNIPDKTTIIIKSIKDFYLKNNFITEKQAELVDRLTTQYETVGIDLKYKEEEKKRNKSDFKEFWDGKNHPEDVKFKINTIKRRLAGTICDAEWNEFMALLEYNCLIAEGKLDYDTPVPTVTMRPVEVPAVPVSPCASAQEEQSQLASSLQPLALANDQPQAMRQ